MAAFSSVDGSTKVTDAGSDCLALGWLLPTQPTASNITTVKMRVFLIAVFAVNITNDIKMLTISTLTRQIARLTKHDYF